MKAEAYSFGRITIDGKTYTSDVIIYPDRIDSSWWRKEGHLLQMDDLSDVIQEKPNVLIVGKGYSGVMNVPEETIKALSEKNIEVYVERTSKAIELYNEMEKDKKIIAAFHLTC